MKRMGKKSFSSLALTLLSFLSYAQVQEKQLVEIFDHDKKLCLEEAVTFGENELNADTFRFFSFDKSYSSVQVAFDTTNRKILNFQKLKSFLKPAIQASDSTTFIVCFYVDNTAKFKEYRVMYNNDYACLSEFKRRIKNDNMLKASINKVISSVNCRKPFVFIKEWKCFTSPLWSTFDD